MQMYRSWSLSLERRIRRAHLPKRMLLQAARARIHTKRTARLCSRMFRDSSRCHRALCPLPHRPRLATKSLTSLGTRAQDAMVDAGDQINEHRSLQACGRSIRTPHATENLPAYNRRERIPPPFHEPAGARSHPRGRISSSSSLGTSTHRKSRPAAALGR